MSLMKISVQKIHSDSVLPELKTVGSAGYDLFAYAKDGMTAEPMKVCLVPTGLRFEIPSGFDFEIRPRSGLSTKHMLLIPNSPGTIDSDYRGELFIPILNLSKEVFQITHSMRIAQLLIRKTIHTEWIVSDSLLDTERGAGGFGSTGI